MAVGWNNSHIYWLNGTTRRIPILERLRYWYQSRLGKRS